MKLRTTVQLSGAISNTIQKSKPPLKREDSFLKRFSTRQIPEAQVTAVTVGRGPERVVSETLIPHLMCDLRRRWTRGTRRSRQAERVLRRR